MQMFYKQYNKFHRAMSPLAKYMANVRI